MPNGYTGGFQIKRKEFLDVLKTVPGNSVVGMGLIVAPLKRLGNLSASEMIRRLEASEPDLVGVEEEYRVEYTAFVRAKDSVSQQTEILALVIRSSSPIYDSFRARLKRDPKADST